MQFLDWDFAQDLSAAEHVGSAEQVHFTRSERSVLQTLMSYKGRVWSRNALLNAVSGIDTGASERSIDFIVNRLRRKLRDAAHQPCYIESRYGEGYVWIADTSQAIPATHAALPPVRARLRGNAIMSYCDRPKAERAALQKHADSVLVLRLQGYLFYGAANRLFEEIRQQTAGELDYLVIDFRDVLGVDGTAIAVFMQLQGMLRDRNVELIFSGVRQVIENRLRLVEARRFSALDAALEWRETQILNASPVEVPAELTMFSYLAEELESAEAATVLQHFRTVVVPAATDIVHAGSNTREMYFLERGTVEVLLSVEDAWVRASRMWPGTLFGEIGFHLGGPRTATVRALEECRLVCMERGAVARLERDFPISAIALHRFLADRAATRLVFYNDMIVDFIRSTL